MFERWKTSFSMTLKMPVGVRWPAMPVDTGACATGTPFSKSVSCCLAIETSISGCSSGLGGGSFLTCSRLGCGAFRCSAASAEPSAASAIATAALPASAARELALTKDAVPPFEEEPPVSLQSIAMPLPIYYSVLDRQKLFESCEQHHADSRF